MSSQPTMRILVVEDDRTSRIVLRRVLESIGDVEVVEAEDGFKAWEMLEKGLLPDLCFVDINMPRMNGLDLLKLVRADKRLASLKVCFCSSVRDRQTIVQAAAYQPDYYVLKPYTRGIIQEQLQKARNAVVPRRSLDPAQEVCARLGIDLGTYFVLLEALINELRALAARGANLLTQLDIPGALRALDSARNSAQALGARRACHLAETLARLFESGRDGSNQAEANKEWNSTRLSMWISASTGPFLEIMQELQGEIGVLEQAAQDFAKAHGFSKTNAGAPAAPALPKPDVMPAA